MMKMVASCSSSCCSQRFREQPCASVSAPSGCASHVQDVSRGGARAQENGASCSSSPVGRREGAAAAAAAMVVAAPTLVSPSAHQQRPAVAPVRRVDEVPLPRVRGLKLVVASIVVVVRMVVVRRGVSLPARRSARRR